MKQMTAEQLAAWSTLPIEERVAIKSGLHEVGDLVEFNKDGVDMEGKIVAIKGNEASIETPWGTFSSPLALTYPKA